MLDGFYGVGVIEEYEYKVFSGSKVTAELELRGFIVSSVDFSSGANNEKYYGPEVSKLRVSIDFDSETYAPTAEEINYCNVPPDRMGYLHTKK
jgi:hypothetical protein